MAMYIYRDVLALEINVINNLFLKKKLKIKFSIEVKSI